VLELPERMFDLGACSYLNIAVAARVSCGSLRALKTLLESFVRADAQGVVEALSWFSLKWRSSLSVSADSAPSGRGFSRHEDLSSDTCLCLGMPSAREDPLFSRGVGIGSMSPTRLSLSMVASLQSPLLFHLARSL
jgi:hypothetical protein